MQIPARRRSFHPCGRKLWPLRGVVSGTRTYGDLHGNHRSGPCRESPPQASRTLVKGIPPGLLAAAVVAVVIIALPVLISLVQAFQGGPQAALDAIKATSATSLLLHTGLITAVAVPASGVLGLFTAWFVERTRLPLPAALGAAARRAADGAAVRHELRVGDAEPVAPGFPRSGRDHRVLLLPDRLPARRRRAARARSGARGVGALARARARARPSFASSCRSFARRCSAGCCSSRSTRWSSSTRSSRSSSRRSARRLRAVPARLQRIGRGRAVVASRSCSAS